MPVKFVTPKEWEALGLPKETVILGTQHGKGRGTARSTPSEPSPSSKKPTASQTAAEAEVFAAMSKVKVWPMSGDQEGDLSQAPVLLRPTTDQSTSGQPNQPAYPLPMLSPDDPIFKAGYIIGQKRSKAPSKPSKKKP